MASVDGLPFGKYISSIIPGDEKDLPRVVGTELKKIEQALELPLTDSIIIRELNVEPNKVYDGMIARADGTDWDPGEGAGIYEYQAAAGWVRIGGTGGTTIINGGFSGLGVWAYRTATTATPPSGELHFDNATIASATNLYINVINAGAVDMSSFLALLSSGDIIYIQVEAVVTQFTTVEVGVPSLAAGVYTFPILTVIVSGTPPADNTNCNVVVTNSTTITGDIVFADVTNLLSVGYPTTTETDSFTDPLVPDLTLEHLKTVTVSGDFTLDVPSTGEAAGTGGHCEYYVTATGVGPWTITAGTNVTMLDANVTITVGTNYLLNIRRFSSTNAIAQLIEIP